jgi:hypothetical protein
MDSRHSRPTSPYDLLAGISIAGALLGLIGWVLAHTVLRNIQPTPEAIEAVRRTLIPELRQDLAPDPLKRWLFIVLTLASPLCVFAGLRIARLMPKSFSGRGFVPGGAAMLAGGIGIYMLEGPSLFRYFVFPASPLADLAIVYGAGGLLYLAAWRNGVSFATNKRLWQTVAVGFGFAVALLPRGLSVRSILSTHDISPFAWEVHFQAVAYSLSQVCAGKPLLTAAPPLYGDYAEFLLPLFKVIGLSIFKFCVVMGLLQGIAMAAVLLIAVRFLRTPGARLLCCAALLYFLGSTCLVGRRPFDPVFQYFPIRFIFPALSAPLFLWAARRATLTAWGALGAFAGLALMWNLETGIAVGGAILFTQTLEAISALLDRKRYLVIAPAITWITMLSTAALFWLFLEIQCAWRPPFHLTADYERLFYQAGYMMAPMPLGPHPWWLVAAAYLLGMGFGIQRFLSGRRDAVTRLALFLSILGIGLFLYYQGRSVDFNLMNASWPAILLAGLLTDRLLRAIRAGRLSRGTCWVALPAVYLGLLALVMLPGALVRVWSFGAGQWRAAIAPAATDADIIGRRVEFIREKVGKDSDCVILADYQAAYFMETGFRSSIDMPGRTEFFFMADLDKLRAALLANPPRHLFADAATLDWLELTGTVNARFRTVATTPDGKLSYLEPR